MSINMSLSVERSALDAALKRVSDTLSKKPIIPITGFVRLSAEDGELVLRTCDLDRQMVVSIPADVDRPGAICLPGDSFRDIVSGLPAGAQVRLEHDDTNARCAVASGRSRYRLSSLPASDHPDIGAAEGVTFSIPGIALKRAISRVAFAVSAAEDRTFLWGAHFHIAETDGVRKLALIATDGFYFSRCFINLPEGLEGFDGITIPTEALATLAKIASDVADIVLTVGQERVSATAGNVQFVTKLVEGRFPDYPRMIPAESGRAATVDRAAFAAALERFRVIDEKGSGISITPSESSLVLSGRHEHLGDAREEVEAEIHGNKELTAFGCAVARKRVEAVLSRFSGEHVLLDQEATDKPIRFIPKSHSDVGHDAMVMPMLMQARAVEE